MPDPCVLIIEDDRVLCEAIGEFVRSRGYNAITACNGLDAMAALRDGPVPAMILLDLHMPGVNGWKFRQMQLLQPRLAEVPVVVTSSLDPAFQRREELRVTTYVDKGRLLDELPKLLERFCAGTPSSV